MGSTASAVRDRASVEHYEPPVYGLDEPLWVARDEETGCSGIGRVEAEAIGNLVSLVVTHETAATEDAEYVKLPGDVVEKTWTDGSRSRTADAADQGRGLIARLFERL